MGTTAIIVDPEKVDVPSAGEFDKVIRSRDVLLRYVQDRTLKPTEIDYGSLDSLAEEAQQHFDDRKLLEEEERDS